MTIIAKSKRQRLSALEWLRPEVYKWPYVRIEDAPANAECTLQADKIFDSVILPALPPGSRKVNEKQSHFRKLFHAGKRAFHRFGVVALSRDNNTGDTRARLQVAQCAIQAKLFQEYRSPPGSLKMSRLLPLGRELWGPEEFDPWTIETFSEPLVRLRERSDDDDIDGTEITYDPNLPTVRHTLRKTRLALELVNDVNSRFRITYTALDQFEDVFGKRRRLRPSHFAIFTETFKLHGRLYTGRFGHQNLRKLERQTIEFDGEPCVELDYSAMHCRMLYDMAGIDYPDDPYKFLSRRGESKEMKDYKRLLVKVFMNAFINAKNEDVAVSACNFKLNPKTKDGEWKSGKALHDVQMLTEAQKQTGIKFKELPALVLRHHDRIREYFGCDMGMKLMRMDSAIALAVMRHFAKQGIPILGVHDSFIAPRYAQDELKEVMKRCYLDRFNYPPVIKSSLKQ